MKYEFPTDEATLLIPGPVGPLELKAASAKGAGRDHLMIICHPHPLYGGTMDNKVVTTVYRTFREQGSHVVRFNYRGVGQSAGEFAHSEGEIQDCQAVLSWALEALKPQSLTLVGFSFGAFIAASVATDYSGSATLKQLISIAPAVNHQPYRRLNITCPWLVLQPEADEVIPPEGVYQWIETLTPAPTLIRFSETSHFFHGKLVDLKKVLSDHFCSS